MSETATVLLAAFGGGLAGAVLQPLITYALQRARAGEEIKKKRERSLRRMIDAEIAHGRGEVGVGILVSGGIRRGAKMNPDELLERVDALAQRRGVLWQPERIPDTDLRSTVDEYHKVLIRLDAAFSTSQYDEKLIRQSANQLEELQLKITRRMDELNWPEVDD